MIELRWITTTGYDATGFFVPETKQLQYRVQTPVGAYAGFAKPNESTPMEWSKWRPVPDVGWNWNHTDTETK